MDGVKPRRAVISVHDKTGVVKFAEDLVRLGCEIVSTGGTAAVLRAAGVPVTPVSDVTGFPEILGGRVKTLHPAIHAGILARATREQEEELERLGIARIDIVAANLYPFVETVARARVSLEEAIENIDIGGPAMVRAAAKNFERVVVVTDPRRYAGVISELEAHGEVSVATRMQLALEAFRHSAGYDRAIAEFLDSRTGGLGLGTMAGQRGQEGPAPGQEGHFGQAMCLRGRKIRDLRYGENPHQDAAFYAIEGPPLRGLSAARQLQGKPLSFNNVLDADAALRIVREFPEPVAVVIKHTNPCGVSLAPGGDLARAYVRAREADPVSAFGSVVGLGGVITEEVAERIVETFVEAVLAKDVTHEALRVLAEKPNLRVLVLPPDAAGTGPGIDVRWVEGGFLVQEADEPGDLSLERARVVTNRRPSPQESGWLLCAMRVVKHVKSNAIVLWKDDATVGVGAGQMNRVGSVRIAAGEAGESARGSVMASDAFFPFRDGIDEAARAGVRAIIQPGGSVRDKECIEAANEHGMAMVFTGARHFRH